MSELLDSPKFIWNVQNCCAKEWFKHLRELPRNKFFNDLGTSDWFEQQITALIIKIIASFVVSWLCCATDSV